MTMTAEDAQRFNRYSTQNAATVEASLPCGCRPYQDVFTYRRWQAQGYQVKKGEHEIKLPTIVERVVEEPDRDVTIRLPHTTAVFCRHQVKPVKE